METEIHAAIITGAGTAFGGVCAAFAAFLLVKWEKFKESRKIQREANVSSGMIMSNLISYVASNAGIINLYFNKNSLKDIPKFLHPDQFSYPDGVSWFSLDPSLVLSMHGTISAILKIDMPHIFQRCDDDYIAWQCAHNAHNAVGLVKQIRKYYPFHIVNEDNLFSSIEKMDRKFIKVLNDKSEFYDKFSPFDS